MAKRARLEKYRQIGCVESTLQYWNNTNPRPHRPVQLSSPRSLATKSVALQTLTSVFTQRGIWDPTDVPVRTRKQPGRFIPCTHRRSGTGSLVKVV
jgi:hypothetical protein